MHIGTVNEHANSFYDFSKLNIVKVDYRVFHKLEIDVEWFDCIVVHYSIVLASDHYLNETQKALIKKFGGLKVLFIQDEMRWIDETVRKIKYLDFSIIFTVIDKKVIRKIYKDDWFDTVHFEPTLTGFVSDQLLKINPPKYEERKIDVSYRARKLSGWCGAFGQEKWIIGHRFQKDSKKYELKTDISSSEKDRLYGEDWIKLLSESRAVLGCESGSSFLDYTGNVAPAVENYEAKNPTATFEMISKKFLEGRDGEVEIRAISPRCFEAAALKTLMIMYEGDYSGILEANKHYVVLQRDHSNMHEVVDIIKNPQKASFFINNSYNEIACSDTWTRRSFVKNFDDVIFEHWKKLAISKKVPLSSSYKLKIGKHNVSKNLYFKRVSSVLAFLQKVSRFNDRLLSIILSEKSKSKLDGQFAPYSLKLKQKLRSIMKID